MDRKSCFVCSAYCKTYHIPSKCYKDYCYKADDLVERVEKCPCLPKLDIQKSCVGDTDNYS